MSALFRKVRVVLIFNLQAGRLLREYEAVLTRDSFLDLYKFTPGNWIKEPVIRDNFYEFSGFLDSETGDFYGKIEQDTRGLFLTKERKKGKPSLYKRNEMSFLYEKNSLFRKVECNLKNHTVEEMINLKFGQKGIEIFNLFDGERNLKQIWDEAGTDGDFLIRVSKYFVRCGWITVEKTNEKSGNLNAWTIQADKYCSENECTQDERELSVSKKKQYEKYCSEFIKRPTEEKELNK